MLTIKRRKRRISLRDSALLVFALCLLGGGLYLLALVSTPAIVGNFLTKPIDPKTLPKPQIGHNRIIIPKIGVNINYGSSGPDALDHGAWWRFPDRGDPVKGGNFIIAAHRFEIESTVSQTWEHSPFYNLGKLAKGDQVLIDYDGNRYLYEVDKIFDVKPTQTEIEAPSTTPKLTLYTCSLGGSSDGRLVLNAKPVGQVAFN